MRALIVLLALANIGFFAWSQWIARPASMQPGRPDSAPRIVLAAEAPEAQAPRTLRLEPGVSCLSLGPFLDLSEAARASTSLRTAGLEPRQRATEGAVWTGWWVALEGFASQQESEPAVERLRQFGVGDAYVVPDDAGGVTVSLGLFTERQRALRRADEVRALGYEPVLSERQRNGTVYWIDVDVRDGQQVPDPADFEGSEGRIVRLEVQACDAAARESRPIAPAGIPDGVPG